MTRPRFLAVVLLLPAFLLLGGCAALEPNHVTLTVGREETETAGDKHTRAYATRGALSATWDLH